MTRAQAHLVTSPPPQTCPTVRPEYKDPPPKRTVPTSQLEAVRNIETQYIKARKVSLSCIRNVIKEGFGGYVVQFSGTSRMSWGLVARAADRGSSGLENNGTVNCVVKGRNSAVTQHETL